MARSNEDHYSNDEAGAAYFERHRAQAAGEDEDAYWAELPDAADLAADTAEMRAAERRARAKREATPEYKALGADVPF